MSRKQTVDYFQTFLEGVGFSCQASAMLREALEHFAPGELPSRIEAIHKVEHAADLAKHEMMGKLVREFITPIEREDIMELANTIDDVTDAIEDVLMRAYMYNVRDVPEAALSFTQVIEQCCAALRQMLEEFPNFRKSAVLREKIININHLEEEGDRLYTEAVRALYTGGGDPLRVVAWTAVFECLEACCDACEDVADVVERVIMKNT